MTLIVWDGRRRKRKRLTSGLPESAASRVPAAQAHPLPVVSASESLVGTPSAETQPAASLSCDTEGSRIGVATRVSGKLVANEPVVVKGCIEGAVIAQDHPVMVTTSGRVSSYLEGCEISVDGQVAGRLKAGDKITLRSRARVRGIMEAKRLECHAGAHIQGEVAPLPAG
ncbi:bactofilin family protein [Billgrantia sp. Q4P2]